MTQKYNKRTVTLALIISLALAGVFGGYYVLDATKEEVPSKEYTIVAEQTEKPALIEDVKVEVKEVIQESTVAPEVPEKVQEVEVKEVEVKEVEVKEVEEPKRPNQEPRRGSREYNLYVVASAYTPDPNENGGSGLCFDGSRVRAYHSVAVDTSVIPMGSKIFVPGIGWMLATDTGGDINGNRIDVCLPDKATAYAWGRKRVEIIVVPPER